MTAKEGSTRRSRRANREDLLADIIDYGEKALHDAKTLTISQIVEDDTRYDAIIYCLQCVSEATTQLLFADPDIREKHPRMPRSQIKGIADVTRRAYRFIAPEVIGGTVNGGDLEMPPIFARQELGLK